MTDDPAPEPDTRGMTARRSLVTTVVAIVLAAVIVIASAGAVLAFRDRDPGNDSVEAGFLRDMVTHHAQAVEMAMTDYRRTTDPELAVLTYDLATAQQAQIGMMMATLDLWDLPQTGAGPAMGWMGMPTTGLMPGMATPEQLQLLQSLPPEQADILLLQLMIVHHRAGITMADAVLDRSDNGEVRRLAETFNRTQTAEVDNMNAMLVARGQPAVEGKTLPGTDGGNGITTMPNDATPMDMGHGN